MKRFLSIIFAIIHLAALQSACKPNETRKPAPPPKVAVEENSQGDILAPVYETGPNGEKYELTDDDKSQLLSIARTTVETWVRERRLPEFDIGPEMEILRAQGAAFVTLRKDGQLRGCIGHTIAQIPLWMCVRDMAQAAATKDRRFRPVTAEELNEIHLEVSVLTPLQRVTDLETISMGRDGVIVKKGMRMGVFLPQVATETGWTKNVFLSNLCAHKAGLPFDCWRDSSTELYRFQAIVFEEPKDDEEGS